MIRYIFLVVLVLLINACTYNPFYNDNEMTGSVEGTALGAVFGGGLANLITGSKDLTLIGAAAGGAIGYYMGSLRFSSRGIIRACGQVFTLGEYVTIDLPTDQLFEINTADFYEDTHLILDSVVEVLRRYPNNNIIISGNTSGFGTRKFEHCLAEARARQIAMYLWAHGINDFQYQSIRRRHLTYVGYGNYFPIANNIRNCSIRQNSHIQITAYPTAAQLLIERCSNIFNNIGGLNEPPLTINPARDLTCQALV